MLDDDNKLKKKYINKKVNATKEGIEFLLSFEEFCLLVEEAGLVSSDLGFTGRMYVLARYNDEGPYEYGNCRFILQSENAKEKVVSEKMRQSSIEKCKMMSELYRTNLEFQHKRVQALLSSEKFKAQCLTRKQNKKIRLEKLDELKHPSFKGPRNSQFGSYWITNGIVNKKWRDDLGDLPENFYKGRVTKIKP